MPLLPNIIRAIRNIGTEQEPNFQPTVRVQYWWSNNAGPYQLCVECREGRKENSQFRVGYAIMGAARCLKHIVRYHKARLGNGIIDKVKFDSIVADATRRNEVHVLQRS